MPSDGYTDDKFQTISGLYAAIPALLHYHGRFPPGCCFTATQETLAVSGSDTLRRPNPPARSQRFRNLDAAVTGSRRVAPLADRRGYDERRMASHAGRTKQCSKR